MKIFSAKTGFRHGSRQKILRDGGLHRLRKFVVTLINIRGLDRDQRAWVWQYLSPQELELFHRMARFDQVHCVCVARTALHLLEARALCDGWKAPSHERRILVRAALLHDVGKAGRPLFSLGVRIIAALVKSVDFPKGLGDALRTYREHPEIGANFADQIGVESRVIDLIRRHHLQADGDRLLELLIEADSRC